MLNNAAGARIFTKYDLAAGEYELKDIIGVSPITVTENAASIDIAFDETAYPVFTPGANMDFYFNNVVVNGANYKTNVVVYVRDGIITGTTDPEIGDPAGLISVNIIGS